MRKEVVVADKDTVLVSTGEIDLASALSVLAETQKLIRVSDKDYTGLPTKDDIRQYAFALCGEVHELADELHWKSWQLPKPIDTARVVDEMADVLAFLGVMLQFTMDLTNVSVYELAAAYKAKTKVNMERMAGKVQGYGGAAVQALTTPKGLIINYYYTVKSDTTEFFGLLTAYDPKLEVYWFRELITGREVRLETHEPWEATQVSPQEVTGGR